MSGLGIEIYPDCQLRERHPKTELRMASKRPYGAWNKAPKAWVTVCAVLQRSKVFSGENLCFWRIGPVISGLEVNGMGAKALTF